MGHYVCIHIFIALLHEASLQVYAGSCMSRLRLSCK